jgi:hypothetical protein
MPRGVSIFEGLGCFAITMTNKPKNKTIGDLRRSAAMEALKYIQQVTSDALIIKDMGKYLGKQVEIIILPLDNEPDRKEPEHVPSVRGFLHKYANPALIK